MSRAIRASRDRNVLYRAEPFEVSLLGDVATIVRPTLQGH